MYRFHPIMCGIWSLVQLKKNYVDPVKQFQDFHRLQHRGPDNSYFETYKNVTIGFHRLAIVDDTFLSNQPFIYEDDNRTIIFVCNGEIYNYKELIEEFDLPHNKSDCGTILDAYVKRFNNDLRQFQSFIKNSVRGEFAFLLFEFDRLKNLKTVVVARDEIGVRPLYYHPYTKGNDALLFTSELKGGTSFEGELIEFPPGRILTYHMNELGRVDETMYNFTSVYHTRSPYEYADDATKLLLIQTTVTACVRRRLNGDRPFAFLLSGGVDSSLVAALSAKILGKPIQTFCCGMSDGTDLHYARLVAKHIGSNHTEVRFTPQEGLDAISDVIRTVESWDTTTIRASVGQYLVSKFIGTQTDCKVVMVGEGPDEVCSSYLFNWYAPNATSLDGAAKEYVKHIHYYDVKRADRCISRWGMEGRVPLLDPQFIESYWCVEAEKRMPTYKGVEKWWLRQAFHDTGILPDEVLWRKKEAFSDGVSGEKSWFQIIQEFVEDKVTDEEMASANEKYPYCTPQTKEAYYYRKIFCDFFGEHRQTILPGYWQPKWNADGKNVTGYVDPSARTLSVYNKEN
uniref:asparagine synthase (glutamine-hydrolyzing) n=1 Tax=viral metagenome TaxID=1070528 RepID=A0A6C0KQY5_9ZZZZ